MSEENKFRGKRVNNGEWVYGYYKKHNDGTCEIIVSSEREFTHNINGKPFYRIISEVHEVISETVGQFTGVHDETDDEAEVFKGDIVEFFYEGKKCIGSVVFEAGAYIIVCNELPDSYITLLSIAESDRNYFWINAKVIGNIHDKPDLLGEAS